MQNYEIGTNRLALSVVIASFAGLTAPALGQVFEDHKLLASDGLIFDQFGHSIAIEGGLIVVGAEGGADNNGSPGSAYVFDASTGTEIAILVPNDSDIADRFGYSIDIQDGVVAVGAVWDDDNGSNSGSAYLFDAATGTQIAKLLPDDGSMSAWFGNSIAIDNGIVAVGAMYDDENGGNAGAVYLFDASTGVQLRKLLSLDGAAMDLFGWSVAMSNGVVAVGARDDDDNGSLSGSAYLFDAATGTQLRKLVASDGVSGDRFANSIAIDNGHVVVGAREVTIGTAFFAGATYLFDVSNGAQLAKLTASDGEGWEAFGQSVSISNGVIAVGAYDDVNDGITTGSVYLYSTSTGAEITKLLASDGEESNQFGNAVSIDFGDVAVGAWHDGDFGQPQIGSAYVFNRCPGDLTGDWIVNFFDISAFNTAFAAQDPIADFTGDGAFNFFDISAFIQAFNAGCP